MCVDRELRPHSSRDRVTTASSGGRATQPRPGCWDEQPCRPVFLNARLNHTTMLSGVIEPPRSDAATYSRSREHRRQATSAARRCGCMGMMRPPPFLGGGVPQFDDAADPPAASSTMSQVRLAISPARRPALADSSTITRLRNGFRLQLAKTSRSLRSATGKKFCLFAWHYDSNVYEQIKIISQQYGLSTTSIICSCLESLIRKPWLLCGCLLVGCNSVF